MLNRISPSDDKQRSIADITKYRFGCCNRTKVCQGEIQRLKWERLVFNFFRKNKQKVQKMVVYGRSIGSIGAIYSTKFVQKK